MYWTRLKEWLHVLSEVSGWSEVAGPRPLPTRVLDMGAAGATGTLGAKLRQLAETAGPLLVDIPLSAPEAA